MNACDSPPSAPEARGNNQVRWTMKKSLHIIPSNAPKTVALAVHPHGTHGQYISEQVRHVYAQPRRVKLMDRLLAEAAKLYQEHANLK